MTKRLLIFSLALFLLFVAAGNSQADIKQHPIGLQIWVPDTWSTEIDEGLLMTSSPDDGAIVILMVLNSHEVNLAMDEMDRQLGQIIQDIRPTTAAEEIYINGLKGYAQEGVGIIEGDMIEWMSGLFPYKRHALMVLCFADSENFSAYESMLVEIFSSLQPY